MNELSIPTSQSGEIVLYQPDENISLEVKLVSDTVWLSIDQMAQLFGRDRSVIGKHVRSVFSEGELTKESVWANFAYTAADGKTYMVDFYNLDYWCPLNLADSQTIIFTCFCLDTKATKSQGQDHRPLRGQPNSMTFKKYVINAIS